MRLVRGSSLSGTELDRIECRSSTDTNMYAVMVCSYIDTPAAGTYTYKLGWTQADDGVASRRRLQAVEMKR
jgi:hypothetical protein